MSITHWGYVVPEVLWAEPDDNGATVYHAITHARWSIDIAIYEIGGPQILEALKIAKQHGVNIRIMFNGQFFVGSDPTNQWYDLVYAVIDELRVAPGDGHLNFQWSSNNFNITHQKTIIIDAAKDGKLLSEEELPKSAKALVLTLNLCSYAWMKTTDGNIFLIPWQFWGSTNPNLEVNIRDFGAMIAEPKLVSRIASIFESDFMCAPSTVTNELRNSTDGLVWSNGTTGIPPAPAGYYPAGGLYPRYNPEELGSVILSSVAGVCRDCRKQ